MPLSRSDPFSSDISATSSSSKDNEGFVHIRIQQRNGRKTLTTVQGISQQYDLKKIARVCKKVCVSGVSLLPLKFNPFLLNLDLVLIFCVKMYSLYFAWPAFCSGSQARIWSILIYMYFIRAKNESRSNNVYCTRSFVIVMFIDAQGVGA